MTIRTGLALAAVLVLAAACSEGAIEVGGGTGGGDRSTDTLVDGAPGGAPSGGGGSGSPAAPEPDGGAGDESAGGGGSDGSGGSGGSGSGGSGGGSGGSGGGGSGSRDVSVDDRGGVGSMGAALLRSDVPRAAIEVDATPGESMTDRARSALAAQIDEHGGKTSVGFAEGSALPEQDVYTTADLRSLMDAHRATWSTSDRVAVYGMVLSGRHENDAVVGVAFSASAFAIFPDQLSGGLVGLGYANFEEATVVHELGHLYGLVNLTGHGAFHEDPEHEGHSANDDSVMFWAVESTLVEDVFGGGPPRDFDADDEREIDLVREAG